MNGNSLNIDMTIAILRCRSHKKFDTTKFNHFEYKHNLFSRIIDTLHYNYYIRMLYLNSELLTFGYEKKTSETVSFSLLIKFQVLIICHK